MTLRSFTPGQSCTFGHIRRSARASCQSTLHSYSGVWEDEAVGTPGTVFADWQDLIARLGKASDATETARVLRVITEGVFDNISPPHIVGLAYGGGDNPVMILDTKLGIIHWDQCPPNVESDYLGTKIEFEPLEDGNDEYMGDDESNDGTEEDIDGPMNGPDEDRPEDQSNDNRDALAPWKEIELWPAWSVYDFFNMCKDEFRKLQWIPISPHAVLFSWRQHSACEGMMPMLQDIYRQHGWLDVNRYRKAECLEAVYKVSKERYPSKVDLRQI